MIINRQRRVFVTLKPLEEFSERVRRELRFLPGSVTIRLVSDDAIARRIAERRTFPSIDVQKTSTRKEELLLSKEELNKVYPRRNFLADMPPVEAIEFLLERMKRFERLRRLSLYAVVVAGPLAYLNFLLGWIVTEVGRQPWIIQDTMTVQEGFTTAGDAVPALFAAFVVFYAALLAMTVWVLRRLYAARPREPDILPGASHG